MVGFGLKFPCSKGISMAVSLRYRLTEPKGGREGGLEGMDGSFDQ